MSGNEQIEGWLMVRHPHREHWSQRYVKLNGSLLTFAVDSKFKKIKQRINVTPEMHVSLVSNNEMQLSLPDSANYNLITTTNEEAISWFNSLNGASKSKLQMSIDCLDMIKSLGEGQYSDVWLAKNVITKELVAVKISEDPKTFETEVKLLKQIDCPFIVKYKFSFKYDNQNYLGIEYVNGGDLFSRLDQQISKHDALVFAAEILSALEYLHDLGYIYRDLKPENILICSSGHIKLTDFGLSKHLDKNQATSTLCGTAEYSAPEVLERKEYDFKADIWSFGTLLYEILFRKTPFFSINNYRMLNSIIHDELKFPHGTDQSIIDICSSLLKKNPELRPSISDIKEMDYFENIDWDDITSLKYEITSSSTSDTNLIETIKVLNDFEYQYSSAL